MLGIGRKRVDASEDVGVAAGVGRPPALWLRKQQGVRSSRENHLDTAREEEKKLEILRHASFFRSLSDVTELVVGGH
jgi:hypothetical protein